MGGDYYEREPEIVAVDIGGENYDRDARQVAEEKQQKKLDKEAHKLEKAAKKKAKMADKHNLNKKLEKKLDKKLGFSNAADKFLAQTKNLHKSTDPKRFAGSSLISNHKHPIVFALDVTGSMGDWSKIIYDKLPMFYGQIMMQGYLTDPSVSFCAIGDVTSDDAPLQITDFGQGGQLDQLISKIYLEGGGGSTADESYELAAYFYLNKCDVINAELPYFFVTGDEHFYPSMQPKYFKEVLGIQEDKLMSKDVWKELLKKFNVFHLHKKYFQQDEEVEILTQWKLAIGENRILPIETPKACIDVILGVIALTSKARTMEQYIEDMIFRGQSEERIEEVKLALGGLTEDFLNNEVVSGIEGIKPVFMKPKVGGHVVNVVHHEEVKQNEEIKKEDEDVGKFVANVDIDQLKEKSRLQALKGIFKNKIPNEFFCPINQEIMIDPAIAQDGNSYERSAIEAWFVKHQTSPITNEVLVSKTLVPNVALRKLIRDYVDSNKNVLEAMNLY